MQKKKLGFYLHSYVSPIDIEILTLPLIKAIFFFEYRLIICQTKCLGKENSDLKIQID